MTGITNIRMSSPSCEFPSGSKIPARFGADISRWICSVSRLEIISNKKRELKPISMSDPSYWHDKRSSALLAKSISSAEICISFPAIFKRIWCVVLLENIETLFTEFKKDKRSIVSLFEFSCGITAL